MGLVVGPSKQHSSYVTYFLANGQLGSTLAIFGNGPLIRRASGKAWFVAPASTQVSSAWAGGQFFGFSAGSDKCCVSEWTGLSAALVSAGLTPSDWIVPSITQLQCGYVCRTYWDSFSPTDYWSSTENGDANNACRLYYTGGIHVIAGGNKFYGRSVRAMRCVSY